MNLGIEMQTNAMIYKKELNARLPLWKWGKYFSQQPSLRVEKQFFNAKTKVITNWKIENGEFYMLHLTV